MVDDDKRVWLRLSEAEHRRFKSWCAARGITMQDAAKDALTKMLERSKEVEDNDTQSGNRGSSGTDPKQ